MTSTGPSELTPSDDGSFSAMLKAAADGDRQAIKSLSELIYPALRALARSFVTNSHTLAPTGLAHETMLKILRAGRFHADNLGHLKALMGRAMRQVLIDYERRKRIRMSREQELIDQAMEQLSMDYRSRTHDRLSDVNEALKQLRELDSETADIIELRLLEEPWDAIVASTGLSMRTAKRQLERGKNFIRCRLEGSSND